MSSHGRPLPPRARAFDFDFEEEDEAAPSAGPSASTSGSAPPRPRAPPVHYDDIYDSAPRSDRQPYGNDGSYPYEAEQRYHHGSRDYRYDAPNEFGYHAESSGYHARRPPPPPPPMDRRTAHPPRARRSASPPAKRTDRTPSPDPMLAAFLEASREGEDPEEARKKEEGKKEAFSTGMARKSRFQKEKEEAERKRKAAEDEAAAAYKEFVVAMQGDTDANASTKERSRGSAFVGSGGSSYAPSRPPPRSTAPKAPMPTSKAFGVEDFDDGAEPAAKPADVGPPGKKRSAMEAFASQLKEQQEAREQRLKGLVPEGASISSVLAMEGQRSGSRTLSASDALTTNICVRDLPAGVTEQELGEFFAQWGDVATVKIMWPRAEEVGPGTVAVNIRTTRNAGFTGFVAFMNRDDALTAVKQADGMSWRGAMLKTGWGKAMPLPPRPMYLMSLNVRRGRKRSRSRSPGAGPEDGRSRSRSADAPRRSRRDRPRTGRSVSPRSEVRKRMDPHSEQAKLIESVVERVRRLGPKFESMVIEREKDNPQFAFLREENSIEHQYFQMLLDDRYQPDLPPEPFADEGFAELYSSDSGEEEETRFLRRTRKGDVLGRCARRRFEAMLRGITPRRERIARAMCFALEHAHACAAISELIIQSLLLPATPVPRKIARLYVLSDILHNGAVPIPNAWKYRQAFEAELPRVFAHLGDVARSFPGRMKQEGFKMQISVVLDTWETWLIFPPSLLEQLRRLLDAPASAAPSAPDSKPDAAQSQVTASKQALTGAGDDEVDGEAL